MMLPHFDHLGNHSGVVRSSSEINRLEVELFERFGQVADGVPND